MSKQLHPICFYINDREEMLHQMFSTMKEEKYRAMLPPILKGMSLEELKKSCLEELLGMSSKRIHSIVAGLELVSSSDSEDADLAASEKENSSSEDDSDSDCPPMPRRLSKDALRTNESHQRPTSSEQTGESSAVARPEKTLLEMLELELRARAIRAALTHQEKINLLDNRVVADTGIVIEIKEEPEKTSDDTKVTAKSLRSAASEEPSTVRNKSRGDANETPQTLRSAASEEPSTVRNKSRGVAVPVQRRESVLEIEEVSSDEAMFDDGEPVLIEPVIESIVISSDSEPEKPEEKQESWKERWIQKKDFSSVIKASKLITNVKRKMKRDKTVKIALAQAAAEVKEKTPEVAATPSPAVIQGTVSEFNLLPPATTSLAGQPSVEQTSTEQVSSEQLLTSGNLVSEHACTELLAIEPLISEQRLNEQSMDEPIPIQQSNAELSIDPEPVANQPIAASLQTEQCLNEPKKTKANTGSEVDEASEVSPMVLEAAVVEEEPIIEQVATQQLADRKRKKTDVQVKHSPKVNTDVVAKSALDASAADELSSTQATDKELKTPVSRKKKKKDNNEIVESSAQRLSVEEQTNEVKAASETQSISRKELKKSLKREKRKKGDKKIKKTKSVVSKV